MENKRYKVVKIQPINPSFFYIQKMNINNEYIKQSKNNGFSDVLKEETTKLNEKEFLEKLRLKYIKEHQDNFDINEEYNRLNSKNR